MKQQISRKLVFWNNPEEEADYKSSKQGEAAKREVTIFTITILTIENLRKP